MTCGGDLPSCEAVKYICNGMYLRICIYIPHISLRFKAINNSFLVGMRSDVNL